MDYSNIIIAACTVIGTITGLLAFLSRAFDKIDKRFESMDKRFDKIDQRLDKIEERLDHLGERVSRIEGYISGRDFHRTGS